ELQLGIIVFTNQQAGAAFNAVTSTIKDSYLGIPPIDRVKQISDIVKADQAEAARITSDIWTAIAAQEKKNKQKVDLKQYTGTYHDEWFGDVILSLKDGKLWFDAKRSPRLTGQVFPYQEQTFILKWQDRSFDADAFVTFIPDSKGAPLGIKMKPISPLTDFSYDFQDLDFKKVK
ncbi:MAG: serine hydrolase, partial [Cytophagales bacterium CG18_big_fil_WC_8_21_14_2_50_42_9]